MPLLDALIHIAEKKVTHCKSEYAVWDYSEKMQTNLGVSTADTENVATHRLAAFFYRALLHFTQTASFPRLSAETWCDQVLEREL